jgi:hypothetical protein
MGLTQLMPDTARGLADDQGHPIVTDPFDPIQSIYGGAKYLAQGLDKYGDPVKALMFYHGGPDESQWGAKTAAYPGAIAGLYQQLRAGPQTNGKPMNGTDALAAAGNSDPYLAAYANDPRMATSPVAAQPNTGIALLARAGGAQPGPMPDLAKMSDDDIVNGIASGSLPMLPGLGGASAQSPSATLPGAPLAAVGQTPAAPVVASQSPPAATPQSSTASQQPPTIATPMGPQFVTPERVDWAQRQTQRYSNAGVQAPQWIADMAQMAPGLPMSPEYKGAVALQTKTGENQQTIGPGNTVQNMPGAVPAAAEKAGAVAEAQQVPARATAAEAPRELRGAGTSILYPPGSAGAQQFLDAQKNGGTLPPGTKINPDNSVEVGNVNVPPEVVHQRYEELAKLGDEANAARGGLYEAKQLQEKLNQIPTSGPLTDYLGKLSSYAQQIGVPQKDIQAAALPPGAGIEEANKLSTDLLGSVLKQQFPGRITNTDITAWKNTVPRATTLSEANNFLFDKILMPKFQRSIDRYGYASGLSASDPQLTTYYKSLNDWDNAHPFDSYQIASQFKPGGVNATAGAAAGQPGAGQPQFTPAEVEAEMRRRGLLK